MKGARQKATSWYQSHSNYNQGSAIPKHGSRRFLFMKTTAMKVYVQLLVLVLFLPYENLLCAQPVPSGEITPIGQAYFSKDSSSLRPGNRFLELRFSPQNGELQALIHKKSGVDLKKEKVNCYHTLWGVGVYTKGFFWNYPVIFHWQV
jgi:hypothetical protein